MKESSQAHLPPEVFVDLLDGAPVEASWRQHFEACAGCRDELSSLKQTMALLDEEAAPSPEVPAPGSPSPARSRGWLATAAAAVLATVLVTWLVARDVSAPRGPTTSSAPSDELLPPIEDDAEFQLLLAVSEAMGEDLPTIASPSFSDADGPYSDLTPEQRQRFVETLAEEMRSSS